MAGAPPWLSLCLIQWCDVLVPVIEHYKDAPHILWRLFRVFTLPCAVRPRTEVPVWMHHVMVTGQCGPAGFCNAPSPTPPPTVSMDLCSTSVLCCAVLCTQMPSAAVVRAALAAVDTHPTDMAVVEAALQAVSRGRGVVPLQARASRIRGRA